MTPEWITAIGSVVAVLVSIVALSTSLRRASQKDTDENNRALQMQVRALELDVARNYVMRAQLDQEITDLGKRLENLINNVAREVSDLNRWLRKSPP